MATTRPARGGAPFAAAGLVVVEKGERFFGAGHASRGFVLQSAVKAWAAAPAKTGSGPTARLSQS